MFRAFLNPIKAIGSELEQKKAAEQIDKVEPIPVEDKVAIVQGRFCLAYQKSFCTTCSERCPEEGAITVTQGIPMVNADKCTGCGICHDVCPAPTNAIMMLKKRI